MQWISWWSAAPPEHTGDAADLAAWLPGALKQVTRTLKHTGNLRYLFGLTPGMKRLVAESTSYPPQPYPRVQISAAPDGRRRGRIQP